MNNHYEFTRKDVEFKADGILLRGWLYQPVGIKQVPVVVMAHGYNCIKELYLDCYAEKFVQAGIAVLVYDQRNFGDSGGEIRQELDPWQQVRDYRNAISFIHTIPQLDSNRIGIWGTSYSGGHVLVVAAIDKRVKCVVSQVPTVSGYETMLRRNRPDYWQQLRSQFDSDRLQRFQGQAPTLVPMISAAGAQNASHSSADAWEFFTGAKAPAQDAWRFNKWRNEVTLRSLEMYAEYEPGSYIKRIAPIPLLMIIADNDVVSLTDLQLETFNQAREPKKLILINGSHFAPYREQFDVSVFAATKWFVQHLVDPIKPLL